MKKLRKDIIVCLLCCALCLIFCSGCTKNNGMTSENEKPVILCTTFAAYDWVREILGETDYFACEMLVENGVDLHSYQPSAQDIMKIANCRMLIYVGGESDTWVYDALTEAGNPDIVAISLMDLVGASALNEVELEGVEGHHHHTHADHADEIEALYGYDTHEDTHMQEEESDIHEDAHMQEEESDIHEDAHMQEEESDIHEDTHMQEEESDIHEDAHMQEEESDIHEDAHMHDADEHATHLDEHVWLSLKNAIVCADALTGILCEMDNERETSYKSNCAAYRQKLQQLDTAYADMRREAEIDTILIGDRFPFLYLMEDYEIHYYAAYSGCSADAEASVGTVTFLAEKLKACQLPAIYVVDNGSDRLAETIAESANRTPYILHIYSMQSVTKEEIEGGCTYLSYMEENLQMLKKGMCEKE